MKIFGALCEVVAFLVFGVPLIVLIIFVASLTAYVACAANLITYARLKCRTAWLLFKRRRLEAKLAKREPERTRAVANLQVTVIDPKAMALELQKSIMEGRKPNWSN